MSRHDRPTPAMRFAFSIWMTIVVAGLAAMILIPALGR